MTTGNSASLRIGICHRLGSYLLVRFHRSIPVLRLDMDRDFWERQVLGPDAEATVANERSIFQKLDYACHDQRCFGYPYPIKAGHDRASLTTQERTTLRKQIIDAAVEQGLKRSLFRDASVATDISRSNNVNT